MLGTSPDLQSNERQDTLALKVGLIIGVIIGAIGILFDVIAMRKLLCPTKRY
jgi:hypothetical protein